MQIRKIIINWFGSTLVVGTLLVSVVFMAGSCSKKSDIPVIGIVQPVEDETLDKARKGFVDGLEKAGYSEKKGNIKFIYRNAQNDIPTLGQIIDFFISEEVTAIAANATLSMQSAASKTTDIPIFVMVAPDPKLIDLVREKDGKQVVQSNISGVYDNLTYIDRNLRVVREVFPTLTKIGVVFNNSEPNSQNAIRRLRNLASEEDFVLTERAVTNSNEVQQSVEAVLNEDVEIFFALPDNTIFSTFENVFRLTYEKQIPIVTSEVGLVRRGATISSGPDIYLWGYESGQMAAEYLKTKKVEPARIVSEESRKKRYNPVISEGLNVAIPPGYVKIDSKVKLQ